MVDCSACPLPIKHIIANENRCLYIAVCKGFFDSENMGFSWKFMFDDIGLPERSGKIDVRMGEGQLPGENEQQIFWDNLSEDSLPHWFSCYVPISSYFHIFPESTEKLWDFVFLYNPHVLSISTQHADFPMVLLRWSLPMHCCQNLHHRRGPNFALENRGTSFSGFNEGSPDSIAGWFIMEIPI